MTALSAQTIPVRAVQLFALVVAYAVAFVLGDGAMIALPGVLIAGLGATLIWLSIEDWTQMSFPLPGLVLFLGICLSCAVVLGAPLGLNLATGLAAALLFEAIGRAFQTQLGQPALGRGDSVFIAGVGFLLGPMGTAQVVLIAALGGIAAIGLRRMKTSQSDAAIVPFGPFLAFATWLVFLAPGLLV